MENCSQQRKVHDSLIDISKFVAAFCVMLIHTPFFSDQSCFMWQLDAVLRLAVPFFLLCSGYYFGKKLVICDGIVAKCSNNTNHIKRYLLKMTRMYLYWAVIYLVILIPGWIRTGWFSPMAFVDWGISLFINGSYFHLWYVLYTIYAVIIFFALSLHIRVDKYPVVIFFLYAIEVAQYGYRMLFGDFIQLGLSAFDKLPCLSSITRVLPFFMLGTYISHSVVEKARRDWVGLAACFAALVIERNVLRTLGQEAVSYILFTLPASFFLFRLIISHVNICKSKDWSILGKMSRYMYLVHPMLRELIKVLPVRSELIQTILWISLSVIFSFIVVRAGGCCAKYRPNNWRK